MSYQIYQFEAVSIQEYIFASSKLKEMVGASQMLEKLTDGVLEETLSVCGFDLKESCNFNNQILDDEIYFPRKAGGVFLAVMADTEKAKAFIQTWPLVVQQFMPGLMFSVANQSAKTISEGVEEVRLKLDTEKNTPKIILPELTPISQRSQRTGGEVVAVEIKHKKQTPIDLATQKKQLAQNQASSFFNQVSQKWSSVSGQVFPTVFEHDKTDEDNQESFPFSGQPGEHYVAVVHADGNGLGGYIKGFMNKLRNKKDDTDFVKSYAAFSQGMDNASEAAAKEAIKWLEETHQNNSADKALPIRPLILSGDDVALIIRADYAFEFMKRFTKAFEIESEKQLEIIESEKQLEIIESEKQQEKSETKAFPKYLTMTSGIVFLRSNQPFYMAYQLAEDLCGHSKEIGRKNQFTLDDKEMMPSTISFNYVTNTLFEEAQQQIETELTTKDSVKLTQEYYLLSDKEEQKDAGVNFEKLEKLSQCFDGETLKISFIRELLTNLHRDPEHAKRMWNRWLELLKKNNKHQALTDLESSLSPFDLTLENILDKKQNPLSDLVAYHSLSGNISQVEQFSQEESKR